jgi:hypothetical protein
MQQDAFSAAGEAGDRTVVDDFLDAVLSASIDDCEVWVEDATIDVTVPDWRFRRRGADAIREIYRRWFSEPGTFVELRRAPVTGGEVVRYLISSTDRGRPYLAHHVHWLELREGKVTADVVFCGGRWFAERQAEMAADDA